MKPKFLILIFVVTCTLITLYLFFYTRIITPKISFLDVGQGDSILINDGTTQLLVDAGKDEKSLGRLSSRMLPWDKTIEYAIATHPDSDHTGGLWYVMQYYRIENLILSDTAHDTDISKSIVEKARHDNVRIIVAKTGDTFTIGDSWRASVLWPDQTLSHEFSDTNDHSIVLRLDNKKFSTLLTGDASKVIEGLLVQRFVETPLAVSHQKNTVSLDSRKSRKDEQEAQQAAPLRNLLDIDILKLGHHGSKTSSSESFLRDTSPKVAIISAGCDNSYGHPHKEVLDRLQFLHIPFLNTCERGTVTYKAE